MKIFNWIQVLVLILPLLHEYPMTQVVLSNWRSDRNPVMEGAACWEEGRAFRATGTVDAATLIRNKKCLRARICLAR